MCTIDTSCYVYFTFSSKNNLSYYSAYKDMNEAQMEMSANTFFPLWLPYFYQTTFIPKIVWQIALDFSMILYVDKKYLKLI